jgi:hypothetical protein
VTNKQQWRFTLAKVEEYGPLCLSTTGIPNDEAVLVFVVLANFKVFGSEINKNEQTNKQSNKQTDKQQKTNKNNKQTTTNTNKQTW